MPRNQFRKRRFVTIGQKPSQELAVGAVAIHGRPALLMPRFLVLSHGIGLGSFENAHRSITFALNLLETCEARTAQSFQRIFKVLLIGFMIDPLATRFRASFDRAISEDGFFSTP